MPMQFPRKKIERKWDFKLTDRIKIDREYYIWTGFEGGFHHFKKVVDGVESEISFLLTNEKLTELSKSLRLRVDERHFSAHSQLRLAKYGTILNADHLAPHELRTMHWKTMWCARFYLLRNDRTLPSRPSKSKKGLIDFIEAEKDGLHDAYRQRYGESRPLGRDIPNKIKEYDYPGATTLAGWLKRFLDFEYRQEAFSPLYRTKCGNRNQLDPIVREVVDKHVQTYASLKKPTKFEVWEQVKALLQAKSEDLGLSQTLSISRNPVYKRITKLDAFFKDAGRNGHDVALRRFTPVGLGIGTERALERVEIDDWTMDLHVLVARTDQWKRATKKQRDAVPRIRVTVTVAIDVRTRCIVGLSVSPELPSSGGANACLHSMLSDKSYEAERVGCRSDWPMAGRPDAVATDGGAVFQDEFRETLRRASIEYTSPEADPRKRGTVESSLRYFKRLCRYFTGQTFANVLEKGDYDSEKSASVTVGEIRDLIILFVTDIYHHRRHRGLSYATPYAAWETCAPRKNLPDLIDLAKIFGFRTTKRLDKQGITYERLTYNSTTLSVLLEKIGETMVTIRVYPFDMSFILVLIPPQFISAPEFGGDEFIAVPLVKGTNRPLTLEQVKAAWGEVNARNRDTQAGSDRIRLYTIVRLMKEGEAAAARSGLKSPELSPADYEALKRRKAHVAEEAAFSSRLRVTFEASKDFEELDEDPQDAEGDAPEAQERTPKKKSQRVDRSQRPPRRSITGFEGDGV